MGNETVRARRPRSGRTGIGQTLRPTELIIFGNSEVGTSLMLCSPAYGIDLSLRVRA
jgi:uncharacterized protein (DUF302 family)